MEKKQYIIIIINNNNNKIYDTGTIYYNNNTPNPNNVYIWIYLNFRDIVEVFFPSRLCYELYEVLF